MLSVPSLSAARCVGVAVSLAGLLLAPAPSLGAVRTEDRELKTNCQVVYLREAVTVDRFAAMFTEGRLLSRARFQVFAWDWAQERTAGDGQTRDHDMMAAGGSLVFHSARWQGWSGLVGLYTTQPLRRGNTDPAVPGANFGRAGKDSHRTRPDGSEAPISVLAEAYAEFRRGTVQVRAGRQLIESVLLSSNDSKMIPNAFEAVWGEWRPRGTTRLAAGLIRRQKLRDHSTFHSVLAYAKRVANDDSGAHRGLTLDNLAVGGLDGEPHLLLLRVEDRSIPNLRLQLEQIAVESALGLTVAEACYEVKLPAQWTVTPALRALYQADAGAGSIGGAALSGAFARNRQDPASTADRQQLASYHNPCSLEGALWAARLEVARGPLRITVATAKVRDRADLVAPWRGFPTGGFTRAMGQVDWLAGTVNRALRADYDFGRNRFWASLWVGVAGTRMDYDDRKIAAGTVALTDRDFLSLEVMATFPGLPRTGFKLRTGFAAANARPGLSPAIDYESYRELRFDVNHFF